MNTSLKIFWNNNPIPLEEKVNKSDIVVEMPFGVMITSPNVSIPVTSVNGKLGDVVLNAADVGATTQTYVDQQDQVLQNDIDTKANAASVNQALSLKADLVGGTIPASQLPSFVDDVLEFQDIASFPSIGEDGKIYIAVDVNKTYRWGGSSYVEIGGGGVALGETSSTAYRGDRGKIAYDHSLSQGNPHNTTTSDINEGTKLFFTESRVSQTVLTGLSTNTASPALATDQLLVAIGKLQAQINNSNSSGFNWINANAIVGYIAASGVTAHSTTPLKFAIKDGLLWVSGAIKITQANANAPFLQIGNPNYRLKVALGDDVGYITVTHVADGGFLTINQIPVRIVSNNSGGTQGIWLYAQANITPQSYGNTLIFQPSAIGQLLN